MVMLNVPQNHVVVQVSFTNCVLTIILSIQCQLRRRAPYVINKSEHPWDQITGWVTLPRILIYNTEPLAQLRRYLSMVIAAGFLWNAVLTKMSVGLNCATAQDDDEESNASANAMISVQDENDTSLGFTRGIYEGERSDL